MSNYPPGVSDKTLNARIIPDDHDHDDDGCLCDLVIDDEE